MSRVKDRDYLAWIRQQPCCICETTYNVEAAHVRYADHAAGKDITGMQIKSDDAWAVPLCVRHHRIGKFAQHSMGERAFWESHRTDPLELAKKYQRDYDFFCNGP